MANKGFTKALAKGKSLFSFGSKETVQDPSDLLNASRDREKNLQSELASLLSDLDYNPEFKLSKDKIKEFKIPLRIARMIKQLETPLVSEIDETDLDNLILGFVHALRKALRLGYENSAYWSSLALHHALESLHLPVDEYDKEFADLLYKRKLEYAQTLDIIIKHANTLDELDQAITADENTYKRWIKERDTLKANYEAMKTSAHGIEVISNTKAKAKNPSTMSEEEGQLFSDLRRIKELNGLIENKEHLRNANLEAYRTASNAIQMLNDQLRQKPSVTDEKLAGKMEAVNERFFQKLDDSISRTLTIQASIQTYGTKLAEITKRIEKATALEIADTIDNLDMEAVDRSMAKKENAEMAARVLANMRELQRHEELIRENTKILEDEIHVAQEVNEEPEVEVATEPEVEVENEIVFG